MPPTRRHAAKLHLRCQSPLDHVSLGSFLAGKRNAKEDDHNQDHKGGKAPAKTSMGKQNIFHNNSITARQGTSCKTANFFADAVVGRR
jgi:hypothetical protein